MITMTDAAKAKFLEIVSSEDRKGHGLRVIVRNGGSMTPEFALNFVEPGPSNDEDTVFDLGELKIHVENSMVAFLEDASIDFIDDLKESGFKVEAPKAGLPGPDGPLAQRVQEVIDAKINPAIASHGGMVKLVGLRDSTAYLQFGGGCQGCGMIDVTLKQGVQKTIREEVPEIETILDVTDHAAGQNPYYQG